jgi:4-hydroxy-4-methyl-2-oxoglutarate aldolase
MPDNTVSREELERLRRFDACTLSNAIERLNIRPRNEGFVQGTANCKFPKLPPVAGYAVTGTIRSAMPPIKGRCYWDRIEWWRYLVSIPAPRIVVMLDEDDPPGAGALFGEIHARICQALDCIAYITNGAVRDLPAIERLGFQLFAGNLSVSHAYAHIVEFGQPVEIGGLRIGSGDLLHADLHGIQSIPTEVVGQLPAVAQEVMCGEHEFFRMCLSREFSVEDLAAKLQEYSEGQKC